MEVVWFSTPEEGVAAIHSKTKTSLTVFFDWEGAVPHKYAALDQTIGR